MARIAINGFGRIGRCLFRLAVDGGGPEVVAINDLTDAKTLAHLLKYDSVHGRFDHEVEARGDAIVVDGREIPILAERDPAKLPWKEHEVELVVEATGRFRKRADASKHLEAGAERVLISAPATDPDITICYGINHEAFDPAKHKIVSNASCTTNCMAPVARTVLETAGVEKALMTTIHSYTNDQHLLDLPHSDLRRARAAAMSMIPTSTGAAKAVALVVPELKGKMHGMAVRVPTPNVSLVDLTIHTSKKTSVEEINGAFEKAANGALKGILKYETDPTVSIDHNHSTYSAILDAASTAVMGDDLVKVLAWYDNEWGFSSRMLDMTRLLTR